MESDDSDAPLLERSGISSDSHVIDHTSLRRGLDRREIFCVSIGAVIGIGFYVRTGVVEAIGGPGPVIVACVFLGLLAISVAQDQARLLHCWPVRGALIAYIAEFIDKDIAQAVGIHYWFTHLCCMLGLTATAANLIDSLELGRLTSTTLTILSTFIPLLANLTDLRYLKRILVVSAYIKITIVCAIIAVMFWINPTVASAQASQFKKREVIFHGTGPWGYFGSIMVAIYTLSFAFVGVECILASAMEANVRVPTRSPRILESRGNSDEQYGVERNDASKTVDNNPFSRPAVWVPLFVVVLYVISGWIATENIAWTDPRLPSLDGHANVGESIFIDAAKDYSELAGRWLTGFMIVIVITTMIATLYVASRSLYGLAIIYSGHSNRTADVEDGKNWWKRLMLVFCRRSRFHVPWIAALVSAFGQPVLMCIRHVWPDSIGPVSLLNNKKNGTIY